MKPTRVKGLKGLRRDPPTTNMIATIAYQLYLERGCEHGHDVEDWLAAEALLRTEQDSSMLRTQAGAAP